MKKMSGTLVDGLIAEIKRCEELFRRYKDIGPAGFFGAMVLEQSLDDARKALASGDAVEMLKALDDLKQRE